MASITRSGTWVPPGASKKTAGLPFIVSAREGNWERTQVRSSVAVSVGVSMVLGFELLTGGGSRATRLSHHGGVLGLDFVDDADLVGLAIRILIYAEIFLGKFIDVGVGAFFSDFDYPAANFQIAIGIVGINNGQSYARIAADIAIFLPSFGGIENDVVAFDVAPYGRYLGASVGHQRG